VSSYQFGGYDLSPLIDLQYRLYKNQTIGSDFIFTLPLTLAFFIKAQLLFMSPSWFSLIWLNSFIYASLSYIIYLYFPKNINKNGAIVSIALISIPVIYTNHIWHSSLTQMLAVTYCVLILNYLNTPHVNESQFRKSFTLAITSGFFIL
jgi:hypothetical protein